MKSGLIFLIFSNFGFQMGIWPFWPLWPFKGLKLGKRKKYGHFYYIIGGMFERKSGLIF